METYVLQANFCDGAWESFAKGGLHLVRTRRNSGWLDFTPLIALGSLMMRIHVLHVNFCDWCCWGICKGGFDQLNIIRQNLVLLIFTPQVVLLGSLIMRICVVNLIFVNGVAG